MVAVPSTRRAERVAGRRASSSRCLHLRGIEKRFGQTAVLEGVDLSVRRGEIVGLLGENGAGKSTLMNVAAGALTADAGEVVLDGSAVGFASVQAGMKAGISFVHQELSIGGSLNVAENLFLGRMPRNALGFVDARRMPREASEMLRAIGAETIAPTARAGDLRAGEQQLVEIARAVARRPRLLILDEPTSSLTPHEVASFKAYLRRARRDGTAVVFITHRLEEAMEVCDRVVVLRNGEIAADRRPAETSKDELITDMTGKPNLFAREEREPAEATTMVELRRVGDGHHLAHASLAVARGEIFGLFGLVGAGRTELLELLCGARPLREGEMALDGRSYGPRSPHDALRSGVVLVPEGRKTAGILPQHSVRRNASASSLSSLSTAGFVSARGEADVVARVAKAVSIKMDSDAQPITTLSGGNQQKAIFARTFLAEPRLLLLDEPTHGVDVGAKGELYAIIRRAARDGMTVILASSELPEIMAVCDRVGVLSRGELAGIFSRDEMSERRLLDAAFSRHEASG